MGTRAVALTLVAVLLLAGSFVAASARDRVEGAIVGVLTDSMTIRLSWVVDSLEGIEGFRVMRQADPPVGAWEFITPGALPPESPGSYEDGAIWGPAEFRYALYAVLVGGTEEPVGGGFCTVTVPSTPVVGRTWSSIKALYR
jgi:hypothetical protein